MAAQAKILWYDSVSVSYVPGPYAGLQLGVEVTIKNDDLGGENTYQFAMVHQPADSLATLSSTALPANSRKFTPDKYGTYIIRLVVNGSIIDTSPGAILYIPSGLRAPAPGETFEWDNEDGWALARKRLIERSNHGVGAKPSAAQAYHGRIWHTLSGSGVLDLFEVCLKDASDNYVWAPLTGGGGGGGLSTFDLQTDVPLSSGHLVYTKPGNTLAKAKADASGTTNPIGMSTTAIGATFAATILTQGVLELADWSAVQDGAGVSLSPGQSYFLSATNAGNITSTVPTSGYVVKVGRAATTQKFDIDIEQRIAL